MELTIHIKNLNFVYYKMTSSNKVGEERICMYDWLAQKVFSGMVRPQFTSSIVFNFQIRLRLAFKKPNFIHGFLTFFYFTHVNRCYTQKGLVSNTTKQFTWNKLKLARASQLRGRMSAQCQILFKGPVFKSPQKMNIFWLQFICTQARLQCFKNSPKSQTITIRRKAKPSFL